ncbi:glycosyl hydrolase family 18 protein [Salirhabdus sp. Marseille-P4669]|uniref:glycosyl hydrolase family 18 protein n=1 Tax=Salirhabdus sp. Marseille-P4669 TaxID=2042310 RepID=UPI00135A5C46|nr:glycosyl hydrolase family 18 protein [Salirhabdus sp. Marseille-P4669]
MEYFNDIKVKEDNDETIIIINLNNHLTEFSSEFLNVKTNRHQDLNKAAKSLIKRKFPSLKKATVKIMLGTILVSSFTLSPIQNAFAHETDFNMSYLYFGVTSTYLKQIESTRGNLKVVSPSYFDLNADGSLKLTSQFDTYFITRMHQQGIKVVPFLSNHWDRTLGRIALENREELSTEIAGIIEKYNLDGINVDIENVTDVDRENYTDFVRLLREKVPANKEVSVAVAANPNGWSKGWHGSYDYNELAKYSDYLMIMAYDESYQGGEEGPVASLPWVKRSIEYAINQGVSKDKIVLGIPFYGRYWQEGKSYGGYGIPKNRIDEMVSKYESTIVYDEAAQSPKAIVKIKEIDETFTYSGNVLGPGTYHIWYEDSRSIEAKVNLVHEYEIKGTGSWSLGQESPDVWSDYGAWLLGHGAETPVYNPDNSDEVATTTVYTVAPGDTLTKIALNYKTTVSSIKLLNNLSSDTIYVGQKLYVPTIIDNDNTITTVTEDYFEVISDNTPVYDNRTGELIQVGTLQKGQVFKRVSDYGNWHRIDFGDKYGYVHKNDTIQSSQLEATGLNKTFNDKETIFEAKENITVYDNSTGELVPFATILKGSTFPIASDYGNWYRIILSGKVGYVHKSNVEVDMSTVPFGKYFEVTEVDLPVYDNKTGKLIQIGNLKRGQVYERVSDYGNWHRIDFGGVYGYVQKNGTKPSESAKITGGNKYFEDTNIIIKTKENVTVYDNSSGKLVPFATLLRGGEFPIVSDYGNWYRIVLSGKVGYVHKNEVEVDINSIPYDKYFKTVQDLPVYDNRTGELIQIGLLKKGQVYERVSDYGNWHRIDFGGVYGYVHKSGTMPSVKSDIIGENKVFMDTDNIFKAKDNIPVYDNSTGRLIPIATILKGARYPIASDYGNWYRIILSGKVGYVHKDHVEI